MLDLLSVPTAVSSLSYMPHLLSLQLANLVCYVSDYSVLEK